jgi:tetratricopeptide (TPR) repeat protein
MLRLLALLLLASGALAAPRGAPSEAVGKAGPGRGAPRLQRGAPGAGIGAPAAAGRRPRLGVAQRMLKSGNATAAVLVYRRQLAAHPDAPAAHIGLARALARTGDCEEAMEHFVPFEDSIPFGAQAALAASGCAGRLGLAEESLRYDRIALEHEPDDPRALTNLVLDAETLGDPALVAWGLERLQEIDQDRDAPWYTRAVLELRAGQIDAFDVTLALWERERGPSAAAHQLRARAWLDLGEPLMAREVLKAVPLFRSGPFPRMLHAETARRLGWLHEARQILEVDEEDPFDAADADALRARVLTDAGELRAAEALLEGLPLDSSEAVASAWHLARARGDAGGQGRAEADWKRVSRSPLRKLEHLAPLAGAVSTP